MHPNDFQEPQYEATRDILVDAWPGLSEGDLSLVLACKKAGEGFITSEDAPLDRFLRQLRVLGWVEHDSLLPLEEFPDLPLRSYRMTEDGRAFLPEFIRFYRLMDVGEGARAIRDRVLQQRRDAFRAAQVASQGPFTRLMNYIDRWTTLGQLTNPAAREKSTWRGAALRLASSFAIVLIVGLAVASVSQAVK